MNTHTGRVKLIIGPMFARKCLANGTRVVLYNGVVAPVESLTLDDMLTGDDYQPRKITAIVRAWGPQMYTVSVSANVMPASKRQCAQAQARSLASNDAAHTHDAAHAYTVNDTHVLTILVDKYNAPIDVPVATALKMQAAGQRLYGLRQPVHAAHNRKQLCAPAVLGAWLRWEATEWHYCEPPPLPVSYTCAYAVATAPIPREYLDTSPADKRELLCGLYGSAGTFTQDMPTRDARERNCLTFATRHLRDIEQILHSLYARHDIVCTDARTTTVLLHCTHAIDMDASLQCDCMRVPIVITAAPAQQYTGFEIVPVDARALAPSAHKDAPSAQRFMLADGTITHNSTTLCSDIDRYFIANHKCVIVRHTIDTRCLNAQTTADAVADATALPREKIDFIHSGKIAQVPVIWTSAIADVYAQLLQYDVIGIDEVQFFDDCTLAHALANAGKVVICAGLDATYQLQPFGRIGELVALADEVVKLRAVCQRCYGEAAFTERKTGGSDVIEIGAADKYAAICRACLVALSPTGALSPAGALSTHDITQ